MEKALLCTIMKRYEEIVDALTEIACLLSCCTCKRISLLSTWKLFGCLRILCHSHYYTHKTVLYMFGELVCEV